MDEVAEAIRAGDRERFAELAGRHRHELEVHCYRMLGSYSDAEDVVQETLLRAWRRRETFEGRATPRAWLYPDRHQRLPRPAVRPGGAGRVRAAGEILRSTDSFRPPPPSYGHRRRRRTAT